MVEEVAPAKFPIRARTPREIGSIIRERRRAIGLDQATLGRKVGVSRQWVIAVERGKAGAEIGLITRTLYALGLVVAIEIDPVADAASRSTRSKKVSRSESPIVDVNAIVDRARERR
jgi:HTH-type transcriptional regulator/antitoxin HipB